LLEGRGVIYRFVCALLTCGFLATSLATANAADNCKLIQIASFDFTGDGSIIIRATIEGTIVPMALDTGSPLSAIDPTVASNLRLGQRSISWDMFRDVSGEKFTKIATVHDLGLGNAHASDVQLLVWPSALAKDGHIGGTLGADLLRHYDVDIDFAARKVNLFSKDHCPAKVVYWTANNIAIVPIHVVKTGHIMVSVTLDGQPFNARLDTGSSLSVLSQEAAANAFNLKTGSPDAPQITDVDISSTLPVYQHVFKTLSLEGITIRNPAVEIISFHSMDPGLGSRISRGEESFGATNFILGLNELHNLHVYIAYDEQNLYISPSTAPAGTPTTPAPSVAAATAAVH
jgi:predicted aspartyl protease